MFIINIYRAYVSDRQSDATDDRMYFGTYRTLAISSKYGGKEGCVGIFPTWIFSK